jgi:hypothetical protein
MSAPEDAETLMAWVRLMCLVQYGHRPLDVPAIEAKIVRLFRAEQFRLFAEKFLVDWCRSDLGRLQDGRTARKDQTARRDRERALNIEEKVLANGRKNVEDAITQVLIEEKIASGKSGTTEINEGQLRQGFRSWASRRRLIHPMWFERPKKWIKEE